MIVSKDDSYYVPPREGTCAFGFGSFSAFVSLLGFLLFAARASAPAATSAPSASEFSAASISAAPTSSLSSLFSCKEARIEIRFFVSSGEIGFDGFGWSAKRSEHRVFR